MKPCHTDKCSRPAVRAGHCNHCNCLQLLMGIVKGAYAPDQLKALSERLEEKPLVQLRAWCRQEGAHTLGMVCRMIFTLSKTHQQDPEVMKRAVARACAAYVAFTKKVAEWEEKEGANAYMKQAALVMQEAVAMSKAKTQEDQ